MTEQDRERDVDHVQTGVGREPWDNRSGEGDSGDMGDTGDTKVTPPDTKSGARTRPTGNLNAWSAAPTPKSLAQYVTAVPRTPPPLAPVRGRMARLRGGTSARTVWVRNPPAPAPSTVKGARLRGFRRSCRNAHAARSIRGRRTPTLWVGRVCLSSS